MLLATAFSQEKGGLVFFFQGHETKKSINPGKREYLVTLSMTILFISYFDYIFISLLEEKVEQTLVGGIGTKVFSGS